MAKQNITTLTAHTAYQNTASAVYLDIARLRWPNYQVQGMGSVAVVIECRHQVVLVQTPLQAAALAADKCFDDCHHVVAPGANLHQVHALDQPRQEQHRSMRRLPGWDRD